MTTNPLLSPSSLPYGAPDFASIRTEHYLPAYEEAIKEARAYINNIKNSNDPATFENTITALDGAADRLKQVGLMFHNQLSVVGTDDLQALNEKIGPMSAAFSSDISLDPDLFARVKMVYDQKDHLTLTPEQMTLLTDTYKGFVRNGALLPADKQNRLREIDEKLSVLAPTFQNNVTKATETFTLYIENASELTGLPDQALAAAEETAKAAGKSSGYLFTLHAPSAIPFMTYVQNRALREKMWRALGSRACDGSYDNRDNIRQIVSLKDERANLLGYDRYADYVLSERMAGSTKRVVDFIQKLIASYRPAAIQELEMLKAYARESEGMNDIKPWDIAYMREKVQQKQYDFESESLRPYFPLAKVLKGTFDHFEKLFGIRFDKKTTYPVWHADVEVFEVFDQKTGNFMGLLYTDFYPRTAKRPGAWMTSYREQGLNFGKMERPIISIVGNFTKPVGGTPSLLNHEEVETLFHEMGHAMHGMLSECTYSSLSGTNVKWDFVELPSQIQENWTYEPETLRMISGHYQTGETLPDDLMRKLTETRQFMAGWDGLRQMAFSYLDMMWYSSDPALIKDVESFEDSVLSDITLFPRMAGPSSTAFSHIFGGGYAAGYYSYKWAEVLDADAFAMFQERGLYDPKTADAYRFEILSRGGGEDPNVLYVRFRGQSPEPDALLKREGLIVV